MIQSNYEPTQSDFNQISWKYAQHVYGAVSPEECFLLFKYAYLAAQLAIKQGKVPNIVEIGSYCGRSSSVLAGVVRESGGHLTCVDPFITAAPGIPDVKAECLKHLNKTGADFTLLDTTSEEAVKQHKGKIDFLFVDGDHRYEWTKLDCQLWLPKLKIGHDVAFHDYYGSWEGVKKAVDEETLFTGDYTKIAETQSLIIVMKEG